MPPPKPIVISANLPLYTPSFSLLVFPFQCQLAIVSRRLREISMRLLSIPHSFFAGKVPAISKVSYESKEADQYLACCSLDKPDRRLKAMKPSVHLNITIRSVINTTFLNLAELVRRAVLVLSKEVMSKYLHCSHSCFGLKESRDV